MTQYLVAFDDGAMTFPEDELPDVAKAASAVVREATKASKEHLGGFAVVDVPFREAALEWAAKIAAARRCAQQVFEFLPPPSEEQEQA